MDPPPADPCCILCGAVIGYRELFGDGPWLYAPTPYPLDHNSPVQWGTFYRIIFRTKGDGPSRLSDIGRWTGWESDLNNAIASDYHDLSSYIYVVTFINDHNKGENTTGYIVHANCWELLERRFLGSHVHGNLDLDLLVDICYERFCENPYDIHEWYDPSNSREKISVPSEGWEPPEGAEHATDQLDLGEEDQTRTRNIICLRDPLKIPEISNLIRHSIQNKSREGIKRKTRKWSSIVSQADKPRSYHYEQIAQLPLDAIFLILDDLLEHTDIRNALVAFHWKVPDSYWKARVPKDLVFEVEDVSHPMDWQFFFFHICKLQEDSPELRNRRRVLDLLAEISTSFFARKGIID